MSGSPSNSNYYNHLAEVSALNDGKNEFFVDQIKEWQDVFQNKLTCIHNVVYAAIQDDEKAKIWANEAESKLKQFKTEWENNSSIENEYIQK